MHSTNEITSFQSMPIEVLMTICEKLNLQDLISLSTVDKMSFSAALSNQVWLFIISRFFPQQNIDVLIKEIEMLRLSGNNDFHLYAYRKFKTLFNKTYGNLADRQKKLICCLIEGRIDELEAMKFQFSDLVNLLENNHLAGMTYGYFDFNIWLRNQYFPQQTFDYLFSKVEKAILTNEFNVGIEVEDSNWAFKFNQSREKILEWHHKYNTNIDFFVKFPPVFKYNRPDLMEDFIQLMQTSDRTQLGPTLKAALENGYLEHYRSLVKLVPPDLELTDINNACLIKVCENGHLQVLEYLLTADKFKFSNEDLINALEVACVQGHAKIVGYLLTKVNLGDSKLNLFSVACQNGHVEIIKYLEQISYKNTFELDVFIEACKIGHLDVVKYIIEQNKLPSLALNDYNTALLKICEKGHCDVLEYLLPKALKIITEDTILDDPSKDSLLRNMLYSIFNDACTYGQVELVRYLLPQLNIFNNDSIINDAFDTSIQKKKISLFKFLYNNCKFNQAQLNVWLFDAANCYSCDIVNFLLNTGMKIEYNFIISEHPYNNRDYKQYLENHHLDFPSNLKKDTPAFVINYKLIDFLAQAYHILIANDEPKKAIAFLDLIHLICKKMNTPNEFNTPIQVIIKEWENAKNSKYPAESNFAIISHHKSDSKQFNLIMNSKFASVIGIFRSPEAANELRRASQTSALNLIEDIIEHTKVYDFSKTLSSQLKKT